MNRYIAGFLLAVALIVLVIILIVRSLVSSPAGPSTLTKNDLRSYASTGTSVQFTTDSPVAAPSKHNDIIINVSNYQTTLTITKGYDGEVVRTQTYPMTTSAYATFLRSLKFNGFDRGNPNPAAADERGQCALGSRYIYQIIDSAGNNIQRYWYTSCGNGTFAGNTAFIRQLFRLQVPDYSTQTSNID